ncbi:MAG: hypothetical protein WCK17_10005, partial [Verrucomicrobiota bacterium]
VDVMKRASADKYPANSFHGDRSKPDATASSPPDNSEPQKSEPKNSGGVLRSFRKFFSGE